MGDDAEYYIEQEGLATQFKQVSEYAVPDSKSKPLLCWADGVGYEDEIWSWEPMNRIPGVFFNLYGEAKLGSDCFLASGVPIEGDEEDWDNKHTPSLQSIIIGRGRSLMAWSFTLRIVKLMQRTR